MLPNWYGSVKRKCYRGNDDRDRTDECQRATKVPAQDENSLLASRKQESQECLVGRDAKCHQPASQICDSPDDREPGAQTASPTARQDVWSRGEGGGRESCLQLDYPCAERLQPNWVWMAEHLERHGEIEVSVEVKAKLEIISVSTVRRLLPPSQRAPDRIAHSKRQPSGRSNAQRKAIPVRRIPWQENVPGHFEVDLVHHCGLSATGQYVHTLQMIDVATGWSECVAVLGRSYLFIQDGFQRIEKRLPFPIREVHPDNGSEFLNDHLVRFWQERTQPLQLSRSRPYYKNDNRFVEENNFSHVRAYAGYNRLDTVAQTNLLNQLYDQLWFYHNFFQPVMRLHEKHFDHGHVQRKYNPAQTPLDRLIRTRQLTPLKQAQLHALRHTLNPLRIRKNIQNLIDQIFAQPCAAAQGCAENVYLTLLPQEAAISQ